MPKLPWANPTAIASWSGSGDNVSIAKDVGPAKSSVEASPIPRGRVAIKHC